MLPRVDDPARLHAADASYDCRVEDVTESIIVLTPNADVSKAPPSTGDAFTLSWVGLRGHCDLPVRVRRVDPGLWRVEPAGEASVMQRRQYARASADLPVELVTLGPLRQELVRSGWLVDISEGGARCTFAPDVVHQGEEVEFRVELQQALSVPAQVLRVTPREGRAYVILTFSPSPAVADRIRTYVFARQAAERRKLRT